MSNPHVQFMQEALAEARLAEEQGEVPIGAVIVCGGKIIARAHNEVEQAHDATLHAELLALRRASEVLGSWRLSEASLYVTLEPCTMCVGALVLARIQSVYFGAWDPRQGATGSLYDLSNHSGLPHNFPVFPELLRPESEDLLKGFFARCRREAP